MVVRRQPYRNLFHGIYNLFRSRHASARSSQSLTTGCPPGPGPGPHRDSPHAQRDDQETRLVDRHLVTRNSCLRHTTGLINLLPARQAGAPCVHCATPTYKTSPKNSQPVAARPNAAGQNSTPPRKSLSVLKGVLKHQTSRDRQRRPGADPSAPEPRRFPGLNVRSGHTRSLPCKENRVER